jgi:hypothetical protein
MAEETPKPDLVTGVPEVAASFDSAAATLPAQPAQTDCPPKDVVMADAPFEQPAVCACFFIHQVVRSWVYI